MECSRVCLSQRRLFALPVLTIMVGLILVGYPRRYEAPFLKDGNDEADEGRGIANQCGIADEDG